MIRRVRGRLDCNRLEKENELNDLLFFVVIATVSITEEAEVNYISKL
jgi:hypothetical protein